MSGGTAPEPDAAMAAAWGRDVSEGFRRLGGGGEALENATEKWPGPEAADLSAISKGKPGKLPGVANGKADRITIERAGDILGLATRTVQKMSQRGQLPGAALIGRRWTYNEDKLHVYVRNQERATWQGRSKPSPRPGAIGKTTFSIGASKSTAEKSEDRYTQVIQRLRDSAAKQKKPS
jgi:hypothetical protein